MTILRGPVVVLDWTKNLWEASLRKDAKPTDKPKFSVVSLLEHGAEKSPEFLELQAAVDEAAIARFGKEKYAEMKEEGKFESPFRKDIGSKGYDKARFIYRINSTSGEDHPPKVINAMPGTKKTADGKWPAITDKRQMYNGVLAIVSYSPRAYGGLNTGFDPGVALDLRNVAKRRDGEALARGTDASEFGELDETPEEKMNDADLNSLLD